MCRRAGRSGKRSTEGDMAEDDSEYERGILANIEEHGWFCTTVFDPNGEQPSFSYSVGFTKTLNCPEFIVFGLPTKLMPSMLWNVFRQISAGATSSRASIVSRASCIRPTLSATISTRPCGSAGLNSAETGRYKPSSLSGPAAQRASFHRMPTAPRSYAITSRRCGCRTEASPSATW
jgi:hypothetical protein